MRSVPSKGAQMPFPNQGWAASHHMPDDEEQGDSGSDEGSEVSGQGWLAKFSTLKVGPPRGTKPTTSQTDAGARTENRPISNRRPVRTVGEVAKKRLERYCEFCQQLYRFWLTP